MCIVEKEQCLGNTAYRGDLPSDSLIQLASCYEITLFPAPIIPIPNSTTCVHDI